MRAFLPQMALLSLLAGTRLVAAAPPLPADHLTIETLGPKSAHWVYVLDEALLNENDARVFLFDGDTHRRLGQFGAGFIPGVNLSPDGRTTVVATTYFARSWHGARTDVVEFTDNATLTTNREIVLPTKHAQTLATMLNIGYSADSRFLYVAYVTPAASFGVLDPEKGRVLGEIDTAGCVLVIPSGPNRVSSICESGRLLTVTLDAQGHEVARGSSAAFFDPNRDPIFVQGVPTTDGYAFLSFLGVVHEVDFSHAQPAFPKLWSLVSAAEKGAWRPGGIQIGAVHRTLGRLFVPMHRGGEGSHKLGGTEIWVFDMKSHQRVARWPIDTHESGAVVSVQVSQDSEPILFAATERADIIILDARTGRLEYVERQLGQTPSLLLNP